MPALIFSLCFVMGYNLRFHFADMAPPVEWSMAPVLFLVCAMLLIYLVGLADDLVGVGYRTKFLMQVIMGLLILLSGLWVRDLFGFLWIEGIPSWLGWIITLFGIIYVVNAVNLIDGIDGLAAGLSAVALIWYSYVFYVGQRYGCLLLAGATLGTLVPFFGFNVFGKADAHTKIFMGDTGSLTIGAVLVFLTIEVLNLGPAALPRGENLFVMAVTPILLPCFDVARVFFHRIRRGRSPFLPDKSHIHHKLLAIGMLQRQALAAILIIDIVMAAGNALISPYAQPTWVILGDALFWVAINWALTRRIRAREKRTGLALYE